MTLCDICNENEAEYKIVSELYTSRFFGNTKQDICFDCANESKEISEEDNSLDEELLLHNGNCYIFLREHARDEMIKESREYIQYLEDRIKEEEKTLKELTSSGNIFKELLEQNKNQTKGNTNVNKEKIQEIH